MTASPLTMLFPGLVLPDNPSAPADISTTGGAGTVGFRGLALTYDASNWPQQVYVNGALGAIYNGGLVQFQGTGWYPAAGGLPSTYDPTKRQISVDAQSTTQAQAERVAQSYLAYLAKAVLKGVVTIGQGKADVGDWQAGQMTTLTDPRLPTILDGGTFAVHRVTTRLIPAAAYPILDLEIGDAPFGRFSQKFRTGPAQLRPVQRQPASVLPVYFERAVVLANETQTLTAQLVDTARVPMRVSGLQIAWSLVTTDMTGGTVAQGSLAVTTSMTNIDGVATNQLTTGTSDGLFYDVTAKLAAQP